MVEETKEEEIQQGPGAMLKERRESLHLSIEDIANKLHLRPTVVAELENDIIDHAVSMTFTKGYFRLYAKHLGIDPVPVLEAFDKLANPISQPAKLQSFSQKMAKQASDTRLMMFSYFILFVVIAMAVIWWFQLPADSDETTDVSETTDIIAERATTGSDAASLRSVGSESVGSESVDLDGSSALQTSASQTSSLQSFDNDNAEPSVVQNIDEKGDSATLEQNSLLDEVQEQGNVVIEAADAVIESVEYSESSFTNEELLSEGNTVQDNSPGNNSPGNNSLGNNNPENTNSPTGDFQDQSAELLNASFSSSGGEQAQFDDANTVNPVTQEIVFTFIEDCWMNLTDATGENIAYGVKSAGRVMPVTGIPPFEVVLGAPQGVQISVNGVPVDMNQFPAGRTARFTIGE